MLGGRICKQSSRKSNNRNNNDSNSNENNKNSNKTNHGLVASEARVRWRASLLMLKNPRI